MNKDDLEGILGLSQKILENLNSFRSPEDVIGDAISSIKSFSGIEAVAIRKREGDDFPYYTYDGFPESFVKRENHLCSYRDGVALKETDGSPRLECICGAVIKGRTHHLQDFFTEYGSFWTNSTSEFLQRVCPDVEGARGYCNEVGYESMAIIPLRVAGETIGTMQMNDTRKNMFPWEDVVHYERLGEVIGAVLQRKELEQQITDRENFCQSTLDCLAANIAVLSTEGDIISTNKAWRDFAANNGASPSEVSEGTNYLEVSRGGTGDREESGSGFADTIQQVISGEIDFYYEEYPCDSPTEERWYIGYINPFDEEAPRRVVVSHVDITKRKKAALELERLAYSDPKTGVANKEGLHKRFENYRNDDEVGVLSISVGDMDFINMAYGFHNGDRFLQRAAEEMKGLTGEDSLARISAGEFACLLSDRDMSQCVYTLMETMKKPLEVNDAVIAPFIQAGISYFPQDGADLDTLLQKAHMAKTYADINDVSFFSSHDERASYLLQLEKDIDTALERDEFELYCQTIVEAASKKTFGFENLLRWHHPVYGIVPPGDFIPIVENKRSTKAFSKQVIQKACENFTYCVENGKDPGLVTMNLSARDLFSEEIEKNIIDTIREYNIPPSNIGLELTETSVMQDPQKGFERLNTLSSHGIRILLDDFGTGYSSLSYLPMAPEDTIVKIDKGFLDEVRQDPKTDKLVTGVSRLVKELGMRVLAEGVERPEQEGFIHGVGGDYCQGFLYSKPSKVQNILEYLPNL